MQQSLIYLPSRQLFPVHLFRDNSALTISPAPPEILQFLTFQEKSMTTKGSKREKVALFIELAQGGLGPTVMTYHGLWKKIKELAETCGYVVHMHDKRVEMSRAQLLNMHGFRFSQKRLLVEALIKEDSGCIGAPTRFGKCLDPDTPVMMADGSIKLARDIRDGDFVMGQDSRPRRVMGCIQGEDVMYRVIPNKGEPFVCTQDHLLLLRRTNQGGSKSPNLDGKEILVTPAAYAAASKTFRHLHKLVKRSVDFPERPVEVSAYCYGLWLGDGHTRTVSLTTMDAPIASAWLREAKRLGLYWRAQKQPGNRSRVYHLTRKRVSDRRGTPKVDTENLFLRLVKRSTTSGTKRLDPRYVRNSREVRLQLLAGLIDSDGCICNGRALELTGKNEDFVKDVQFLARSLGFRATVGSKIRSAHSTHTGVYHHVIVTGALDEIPLRLVRKKPRPDGNRLNFLSTGFQVENLGIGRYCGFELDGPDRLFLLGDFTVTHNTVLMINTARAYPLEPTVVCAPGLDLIRQLHTDFKKALIGRDVTRVTSSKSRQSDFVVCSLDSLHHCNHGITRLLMIDEPHATAADSRIPQIKNFTQARKIGFGATLDGRFDGRNLVIEGLIGPVLSNRTYLDAVAEGAICPITVINCIIRFDPWNVSDRNSVMRKLLWESARVAKVVKIISDALPREWQTLLFIKNEDQAKFYHHHLKDANIPIAMAKLLTTKGRRELTESVRMSEFMRAICSDIWVQGVTFSDMRALLNLSGGGPYTSAIQKPGRLAEIRPDIRKKRGVLFDVTFQPTFLPSTSSIPNQAWWSIVREGEARLNVYKKIGYEIHNIDTINPLLALIREFANE